MAPPALVNLDNYSDVSFRDTVIRHQNHVAPSANIIQKFYHHVTGNTANLSAADVVSVDGSQQGQWDLMLSTAANRLNANTITTGTIGTWSANSIISVRQASTTIRSANVIVGNLTVTGILSSNGSSITSVGTLASLNVTGNVTTGNVSGTTVTGTNLLGTIRTPAQTSITSVGTLTSLAVSGDVTIDSNSLRVDSANNRVGVVTSAPLYPLDVTGDINTSGALRIAGTPVLSATALGSGVLTSSLTSVGTLSTLAVTGNVTASTLGGQLTTANQPNITTLGPLTDCFVSGAGGLTVTNEGSFGTLKTTGTIDAIGTGHKIDADTYYSNTRFISSSTQFSGVQFANVNTTGSATIEISLNQASNDQNTVAKTYQLPHTNFVSVLDTWTRLIPTTSGSYSSTALARNDLDIDVFFANATNTLTFAVHRSKVGGTVDTAAGIFISMKVRGNKTGTRQIIPFSAPYTGFNVTTNALVWGSPISSTYNGVGFGVDMKNSSYGFDADVGSANFRQGLNLDTSYANSCNLSFGQKWRLFYNTTSDSLEIQRNSGNVTNQIWTTTGVLATI